MSFSYSKEWVNIKPNEITSYIFAPGIFATETQMVKYLPNMIATTGQQVIATNGIEVLNCPTICCKFPEVNLKEKTNNLLKKLMYYLFEKQNRNLGILVSTKDQKETRYSLKSQWIDFKKINLAQELDVQTLKETYDSHINYLKKIYPHKKINIVLYGFSRGAATVFSFLALYKPEEVRAVICEGLFDSIPNVIYNMLGKYKLSFLSSTALKLFEVVTSFKQNSIAPIKVIDLIPDIPILFISSKKDSVVSSECVKNLYNNLVEKNYKKVRILELNDSDHDCYALGKDKNAYESAVHSFYKEYDLPFIYLDNQV